MAITTYTELQAAVADWLNRGDLASQVPQFIALAEAAFNRTLRTRQMVVVETLSVTGPAVPLPAAYVEMRRVVAVTTPSRVLDFAALDEISRVRSVEPSGPLRLYSIAGGDLVFAPAPSASMSVELTYYARIPALSSAAPGNWLLTAHPDLYLYGALLHAAPYLGDDGRAVVWKTLHDQIVAQITEDDQRAVWTGSPLTIAPE